MRQEKRKKKKKKKKKKTGGGTEKSKSKRLLCLFVTQNFAFCVCPNSARQYFASGSESREVYDM